jgi:tetratricopeptide (TPR) repeat protein
VAWAGAVLVSLSVVAARERKRRPYVTFGWLWFLATLFPVAGFVQSGLQATADRFSDLPSVGLAVAVVWAAAELTPGPRARAASIALSAGTVLACIGLTSRQLVTWKDSETLYRRAVTVTAGNYVAEDALAVELARKGLLDEAVAHGREAVRLRPDFATGRNNLGVALARSGLYAEARLQYQRALEILPDYLEAMSNLGIALAREGDLAAAESRFRDVLAARPEDPDVRFNLGTVLGAEGRSADGAAELRRAAAGYRAAGRTDAAEDATRKAADLDAGAAASARPDAATPGGRVP